MSEAQIVWPKKTREFQNSFADSARWNDFKFRDGDIVVASYPKSGTTVMQQVVRQLVFGAPETPEDPSDFQWPERVPMGPLSVPPEATQANRCILKTHLPIDALVFSPTAKYIYVARDPRDVVWSAYNHLIAFPDIVWKSGYPGRRPEGDERDHYLDFLADKCAPMPTFGDYWDHVRGWWAIRGVPNILFVHNAHLKADLADAIRRVAAFLDIALDDTLMPKILKHCSIDYMRNAAVSQAPSAPGASDFMNKFFNKGTNGRWKDVLSAEEIARCDEVAAQNLTPDCAHWLKTGEMPK